MLVGKKVSGKRWKDQLKTLAQAQVAERRKVNLLGKHDLDVASVVLRHHQVLTRYFPRAAPGTKHFAAKGPERIQAG